MKCSKKTDTDNQKTDTDGYIGTLKKLPLEDLRILAAELAKGVPGIRVINEKEIATQ